MKRRWAVLPLMLAALAPLPAEAAPPSADPWFGPDKALHFTVSAMLGSGVYGVSTFYTDNLPVRVALGAGVSITVGAAKELFDLRGGGNPSWKDFTGDVIGTAFGLGIAVSLDVASRSYSHP